MEQKGQWLVNSELQEPSREDFFFFPFGGTDRREEKRRRRKYGMDENGVRVWEGYIEGVEGSCVAA